jgi:hypothetical protein
MNNALLGLVLVEGSRPLKSPGFLLCLLLIGALPTPCNAQMAPIFGPKQYTRGTGKPESFTDAFQNCETAAQYDLVVVNGNPDGSDRVSSATILLNGTQVAGPDDFNQNVAQVTKPVAVASSNMLEATLASKPGSFLTVSLQCASNCLGVQVTTPTSGSSLSVSATNVGGTVSSSADEVGVVVNGVPGLVQNGLFQVPNVPLVLGANTLTAMATNACLNQASATEQVTVTAFKPPTVTVTAVPATGVAPLGVTFTATVSSTNPIVQYQWDFNGDGIVDATGPNLSQVSTTYSQPGLFTAALTTTDTQGDRFSADVPILVLSADALNTLLNARWESLKAALLAQDMNAIAGLLLPQTASEFQRVFGDLGAQVPQIASELGDIGLLSAVGGLAEFTTIRHQQGQDLVYFIYFIQDENGLWKIESM